MRADADESDPLFARELDEFLLAHRTRVAVNQQHFMPGVSACRGNIQRRGMKLRVTPLSGLYSRILTAPSPARGCP